MKRKTYKTRRLVIRPYRKSDYKAWFECQRNRLPAQYKYDVVPPDLKRCTRDAFEAMRARREEQARKDSLYVHPVFLKSGELVGSVDIAIIARGRYQMANLGYQFNNRYWGKGYAREAVAAVIRGAFRDLKLHRLEAIVNLDNRPSIRLCKALKLRDEGVKKKYFFENGEWTDNRCFVAIPEDFGIRPRPGL